MSIEAINDFFKLLNENEILGREFDSIKVDENYKQSIIELAKRYRCEFSLEELETVIEAAKRLKEQGFANTEQDK